MSAKVSQSPISQQAAHQTLRVTPAMKAGIADQVWEMSELVALIDSLD
jgi:hypothetical protein